MSAVTGVDVRTSGKQQLHDLTMGSERGMVQGCRTSVVASADQLGMRLQHFANGSGVAGADGFEEMRVGIQFQLFVSARDHG